REPRDDLISAVVAAEAGGVLDWGGAESFEGFAKDDLVSFAQFILIAGNETTRNAISRGMLALIEHPDQRDLLRARPELLPRAVDEILRWSSPVRACARRATRSSPRSRRCGWSSRGAARATRGSRARGPGGSRGAGLRARARRVRALQRGVLRDGDAAQLRGQGPVRAHDRVAR